MYDTDKSGEISRKEGEIMIRSFFELSTQSTMSMQINETVEAIFRESGCNDGGGLTLEMFTYALLKDHRDVFASAHLNIQASLDKRGKHKKKGRRGSQAILPAANVKKRLSNYQSVIMKDITDVQEPLPYNCVQSDAIKSKEEKQVWRRWMRSVKRYVENYRRHIFCLVLFYSVTVVLMVERATRTVVTNHCKF